MSAFSSVTTFFRTWLGVPSGPDAAARRETASSRYGWAPGSPSARLDRDVDELRRRVDGLERALERDRGGERPSRGDAP